jgi:hypothetical protein
MQPYFFPYLGYFDLIARTDRWVVFDTPQFIRHGWVNRNRVLHPASGWQYITVPLKKHPRDTAIRDIEIHDDARWKQKILGQLGHYRKRSPFFQSTVDLMAEVLARQTQSLAELNVAALERVCRHLNLSFQYEWFSRMGLTLGRVEGPGDWALEIASAIGATEYVNPPGGAALFDAEKFASRGIQLTIQQFLPLTYATASYEFVPHLSIIDVLMWNPPEVIRRHLVA